MKIIQFIILLMFSSPGWSCVCEEISDGTAFREAKSVLIVQITSTEFKERVEERSMDYVSAKFKVIEVIKGKPGKLNEIRTLKSICELPLVAGELYIIFSRGSKYESINTCTNSSWINLKRDKERIDVVRGLGRR